MGQIPVPKEKKVVYQILEWWRNERAKSNSEVHSIVVAQTRNWSVVPRDCLEVQLTFHQLPSKSVQNASFSKLQVINPRALSSCLMEGTGTLILRVRRFTDAAWPWWPSKANRWKWSFVCLPTSQPWIFIQLQQQLSFGLLVLLSPPSPCRKK